MMKLLNYYIISLVYKLHFNKSIGLKETAIWALLNLLNVYIAYFLFLPLGYILFGEEKINLISTKEQAIYFILPLIIIELFYFFWDTRWLKLYEEVKEWPKQKIIKQRNILLTLFIVITSLSIIYQYYNFSFGRW